MVLYESTECGLADFDVPALSVPVCTALNHCLHLMVVYLELGNKLECQPAANTNSVPVTVAETKSC